MHRTESALSAYRQPGVSGGGGIHLSLHQGCKIEQAGDNHGHIRLLKTRLMQQHLQILTCTAGQAVHPDTLTFQVRRLSNRRGSQRHHVENVLRVDVVDHSQFFAFVERSKQGPRIGEGHIGLTAQEVAQGIAPAGSRHIAQGNASGFEEAFLLIHQQVGDFGDGLAPAGHHAFVQGGLRSRTHAPTREHR